MHNFSCTVMETAGDTEPPKNM